ncbi:hypothetical protein HZA86_01985 [Candidatus Uhrbacteria bacterium]|nr:hypothetical protein [Candidatus Uhrbacteria bacterium]
MSPEGKIIELPQRTPQQEAIADHLKRSVSPETAERYDALVKSVMSFHTGMTIDRAWTSINRAETKHGGAFFTEEAVARWNQLEKLRKDLGMYQWEVNIIKQTTPEEEQRKATRNLADRIQRTRDEIRALLDESEQDQQDDETRIFTELKSLRLITELGMATSGEQNRLAELEQEWGNLQQRFGVSASAAK